MFTAPFVAPVILSCSCTSQRHNVLNKHISSELWIPFGGGFSTALTLCLTSTKASGLIRVAMWPGTKPIRRSVNHHDIAAI
jgi:hypothetical protein